MRFILVASLAAALLVGCGKKEDSLAKKVGEALGKQATDFTKGVGEGIDQKMMIQVSLTPQVQTLGLTNTVAKSLGIGSSNGISVYFIASKDVAHTLIARALNGDGMEIGRSKKMVQMQKDDAAYVTFSFDEKMDTATVRRYEIGQ